MINTISYKNLLSELGARKIKIIAVSKTQPADAINDLYNLGQKAFGENRAQEMEGKYKELPQDIEWHYIGHLQTNKIKYIIPFVHLIHSVDSFRLLTEINKEALKHNRIVDCLLQIYIATEETKYGFSDEEIFHALCSDDFKSLNNIRIRGLMGMATFTDDMDLVRKEFRHLKQLFDEIKANRIEHPEIFTELSMGMTDDYKVAVEEGSTMVRIGTLIFGNKVVNK